MRRLSLKTEVFLNLLLVVTVAMGLVAAVVVKLDQRERVLARVESGKAILSSAAALAADKNAQDAGELISLFRPVIRDAGFDAFELLDGTGRVVAGGQEKDAPGEELLAAAQKAISTQTMYTRTTTELFSLSGPKVLYVAYPVRTRDGLSLAGVIVAQLSPWAAESLARLKVLWIYLFFVGVVMVIFGTHLLARLVVEPVKRLIELAGEFREEEFLAFDPENPVNELSALLDATKMMVTRLREQRENLAENCVSLEEALKDLKDAQREVVRSEKLASLGQLAAGLAHELGNPLGIAMGYLGLLKDESLEHESREDVLARMQTELDRMDQTVRALLSYARPAGEQSEVVEVGPLIKETVAVAGLHKEMKGIDVEIRAQGGLRVRVDPEALRQALMNLLINSAQAMDHRGAIFVKADLRGPNQRVLIRVKDTGPGVSEEDAPRIFDPFYTDKPPGKGTGLGLAVAMRLMEAAGGSLKLENPGGKGACFVINLPGP